nr:1-deoxy-D-xylulose-5-phosphate reductoisomerase [Oceanococcus sp. HetDA_MAG_MS8]
MRGIAILGATGSIGRSTLDVVARAPEAFSVEVLSAQRNVDAMAELVQRFRPRLAIMVDADAAAALRDRIHDLCPVLSGPQALVEGVQQPGVDMVMVAIVGACGLAPTLAAAQAGHDILLATKEALVTAGPLLLAAADAGQARLLPIDSEHNAIFQCLPQDYRCGQRPQGVRRLILTASGGPFRNWSLEAMAQATPAQAVAHPKWDMGRKISVDSATMMNKGLELIEAAYLYDLPAASVDILIHPQSIVHSLVEYADGSQLAQLGSTDMRIPIAHALHFPERGPSGAQSLDLAQVGQLEFSAPDTQRFPALRLARAALESGGIAPAVLNAANEIAVAGFLEQRIGFGDISALVEHTLETSQAWSQDLPDLEAAIAVDARARDVARQWEAAHA